MRTSILLSRKQRSLGLEFHKGVREGSFDWTRLLRWSIYGHGVHSCERDSECYEVLRSTDSWGHASSSRWSSFVHVTTMVASGAAKADPQVAAVVTTAGAAAATVAPIVSAAAPYALSAGALGITSVGLGKELWAVDGQCTW